MKQINDYITEKFHINSKSVNNRYTCQPENKTKLVETIMYRLAKDKDADLNDIDISKVTDMVNLFTHLQPRNINISEWDVSHVTNFANMFNMCVDFNCDLSKWDVSNGTDFNGMFWNCKNFNCDLTNWKTKSNANINNMFRGCDSLEWKNKPTWWKNETDK